MDTNYVIFDKNRSRSEQESQLRFIMDRVGRVSELLYEPKPTAIPFVYKFPIININEQQVFLKETMKYVLFEELPKHYQEKIYIAEKVNFYNQKFLSYLLSKNLTETEFSSKNPKTKLDIFYDFLFSNQMDIGILEL